MTQSEPDPNVPDPNVPTPEPAPEPAPEPDDSHSPENREGVERESTDDRPDDLGDGPSSHETAGVDPAGEVAASHGDPADYRATEDGPSSHETAGVDPAGEVRSTFDQD